jgi:serine/threonine protein kinase
MIAEATVLNGRYRLDRKIGAGGFAQVYLAHDLNINGQVAVKILNPSPDPLENQTLINEFRKEAQAVVNLGYHPNILGITDYGQYEDVVFLVMPLIPGGTLQEKLRQEQKLSLDQTGRYLSQVASALDFAHQRNIIHRDVKPQNLLIQPQGDQLLLADFGVAKVMGNSTAYTHTRTVGTLAYMAPEQLRGEVSPSSDIYALGCILFYMLTGDLPYNGSPEKIITDHMTSPIPSILERSRGQVPPSLQGVIDRALAKNPMQRFRIAGEMAQAYQQALNNPMPPQQAIPQNYPPPPPQNIPPMPPRPPYAQPAPHNEVTEAMPLHRTAMPPIPSYAQAVPVAAPKKSNALLYGGIGGGVALVALIAVVLVLVFGNSAKPATVTPTVVAAVTPTVATTPVSTLTQAAQLTVTAEATGTALAGQTATAASNVRPSATPTVVRATPTPTVAVNIVPARTISTEISLPSGYKLFSNNNPSQINIELAYPESWKITTDTDNNGVNFFDGKGSIVSFRRTKGQASLPPEAFNASLRETNLAEGYKPTSDKARQFGIAGEIWIMTEYQKADALRWLLVSLHNGVAYAIYLDGNEANFDKLLAEEFSYMLSNFRFADSAVFKFANETKEFKFDSLILNYRIKDWEAVGQDYVVNKTNKTARFYLLDSLNTGKSINQLMNAYADEFKNDIYKESTFSETGRSAVYKIGNSEEMIMRYKVSGTSGSTFYGEIVIRKTGQSYYSAFYRSDNAADLDTMYEYLWRYTIQIK